MLTLFRRPILGSIIVALMVGVNILWDYYNGGVPAHHLLAREDMPSISNWWGLITIPALTWICITLINKREKASGQHSIDRNKSILYRFIGGLVFGFFISALWEFKLESILQYAILFPLLIAPFKKIHFPECLLGFVLGLTYTFGGILPIGIGLFLLIFSYIIYTLINSLRRLF